jgi:hypothetical protein
VECCALGAQLSTQVTVNTREREVQADESNVSSQVCDCDAALCDGACMGNLERTSQSCQMLQMSFELPACMIERLSATVAAMASPDSTCDAMCSALPDNPCAARCAAGECLYWCGHLPWSHVAGWIV